MTYQEKLDLAKLVYTSGIFYLDDMRSLDAIKEMAWVAGYTYAMEKYEKDRQGEIKENSV